MAQGLQKILVSRPVLSKKPMVNFEACLLNKNPGYFFFFFFFQWLFLSDEETQSYY